MVARKSCACKIAQHSRNKAHVERSRRRTATPMTNCIFSYTTVTVTPKQTGGYYTPRYWGLQSCKASRPSKESTGAVDGSATRLLQFPPPDPQRALPRLPRRQRPHQCQRRSRSRKALGDRRRSGRRRRNPPPQRDALPQRPRRRGHLSTTPQLITRQRQNAALARTYDVEANLRQTFGPTGRPRCPTSGPIPADITGLRIPQVAKPKVPPC
jgi:hypothetical protein